MELKYIGLLMGILMVGSVAAYVADSSDYVTLILNEDPAYVVDDSSFITLILDVTPPNTCTYSGSGIWEVDCSDYCNITSDVNMGTETLVLAGTGIFTVQADITVDRLAIAPTCILNDVPDETGLRIVGD